MERGNHAHRAVQNEDGQIILVGLFLAAAFLPCEKEREEDKEYAEGFACGKGFVKEEDTEREGEEHTAQRHKDGIDRKIGGGEGFQTGGDGE